MHTHTHTVHMTRVINSLQRPLPAQNTITTKRKKISARSLIRTRDPSNQATAHLHLRLHDRRNDLCLTSQCISFYFFLTSEHSGYFCLPIPHPSSSSFSQFFISFHFSFLSSAYSCHFYWFSLETPSDFRSFKLFFPICLWILPQTSLFGNSCVWPFWKPVIFIPLSFFSSRW